MQHSLNKREKLSNKQDIQTLFSQGKAFFVAPLQLLILPIDRIDNEFVRIAFSAPKKKYPTAVQRNRIKRLCREAYRLQKDTLLAHLSDTQSWHLMVIYTGKEILTLDQIQKVLNIAFKKISNV